MADQEAHTAAEKLRKRLRNGGAMQPLLDQVLAKFDEYEQALASSRVITSPVQSNTRIQHDVPSQRELDVVSTAFNTAELFEQILLHVPVPDLLRAQRVCKQFHKTTNETASLHRKISLARNAQWSFTLRTVRHVGQGRRLSPQNSFHHFALLRPDEWRNFELSAMQDDMYVAHPAPKGFMIRQSCLVNYTKLLLVSVSSGVKFKHVFAALHDLLWDGSHRTRACGDFFCPDQDKDHLKDNHPIQIDICWDEYWETWKGRRDYIVYDGRDGADVERWRQWLRWKQVFDRREWDVDNGKPPPEP